MPVGELLGIGQRAARRHGQEGLAVARMNPQRIAPRASMPAQTDRIDLRAVLDEQARRFGGAAIKEGAGSHFWKSGQREIARILPYPPPAKRLGAKTNHLPNIQGVAAAGALYRGAGNIKFCRNQVPNSKARSGCHIHSLELSLRY